MRVLTLVFLSLLISIPLSSQEIKHVWDLASMNPKQYDGIFRNSTVTPQVSDFRGNKFNGFILYVANKKIGALVYKLYTGKAMDLFSSSIIAQALTFQKRFYTNLFYCLQGRLPTPVSSVNAVPRALL